MVIENLVFSPETSTEYFQSPDTKTKPSAYVMQQTLVVINPGCEAMEPLGLNCRVESAINTYETCRARNFGHRTSKKADLPY